MHPNNTRNSFTKDERLLKRSQFLHVSDAGKKIHTAHFIILGLVSADLTKIGITVSRKVGNAVCRNRIRRLVREFYRLNKQHFAVAYYNIIAKRGAEQLNYQQVCRELANALERLYIKPC
ncbi:ribonuclease P protein component [Geotalea toluenoxydans]|uniref:ribonuclease P protein component n=1 Tax=Geotalea toluenoxydans TaxID=421624 RepID=UPI0006CF8E07|nr:ribonuclease P protein component [Geotalea toluenoxydans]